MKNHEVIETLNNLAIVSRDGEQGFRTAAEQAQDPQLKTVFQTAAQRCAAGARELESEISELGGQPSGSTSILGAFYRFWANLRSLIAARSDKAILEEMEQGEDAAKSAYESAIAKPLPSRVQAIIDRQYRGVKANHDRVRDLRNRAA